MTTFRFSYAGLFLWKLDHLTKMIFRVGLILLACSSLIFVECKLGACVDNETLAMDSDGYRYIRKKDPLISALYREWWFFALYDPKVDIGFCMGYSVTDPAKTFGLQMSGIAGMLWNSVVQNTGVDPINVLDPYEYTQFSAHQENATVNIGTENYIKVHRPTTYEVVGKSKDGQMR